MSFYIEARPELTPRSTWVYVVTVLPLLQNREVLISHE